MLLSQTSETALRLLIFLARKETSKPVSARRIGETVGGSETYLAKIIRHLVQAGLLRSFRGAAGGVVLDRPASQISLHDVVRAVQGVIGEHYCRPVDAEAPVCQYHRAMQELRDGIIEVLI